MKTAHLLLLLVLVGFLGIASPVAAKPPRTLTPREILGPLAPHTPIHAPEDGIPEIDALVHELRTRQDGVPSTLRPVVIVASLIGSKLQAQLNGYQSKHWWCLEEWKEWFTIWADFSEMISPLFYCWKERMSLEWDPSTGLSYDPPGVNMRFVDYGGVDGLTYLDDAHTIPIWNETVFLLESLGWTVGKNLRGAPYDWRHGPETYVLKDWPRLRVLIEDTYYANNNSKVAAVSLSMGSPYFLAFLNTQTQAWKDKFVHSFTSLDGAFGGSALATSALATMGYWQRLSKVMDVVSMRELAQTWPSMIWMMPLEEVFGDHVFLSTLDPPRNYTVADFASLLTQVGAHNASAIFSSLQAKNWFEFDAPGVESHAFFGTGVPTPIRYVYNTSSLDAAPTVINGDGDGTVPEIGLRMLERWRGKQAAGIYSYPIPGLVHGTSVQNKQVLRMFIAILLQQ